MNLLSLKYFITIAEYSSFTKAADHLYVTQPTLSRQISLLEEEFGVQLFERSKKSLMLTNAGRMLLPEAKDIVSKCDNLTKMMKESKKNQKGSLSIGYQGFLNNNLLNDAFKTVTQKYPYIDFSLQPCNFGELNHFLMEGRFDIIYTVTVALSRMPNIQKIRLQKNEMQIVVPNCHPLANQISVRLEDLADEGFILMEHDASPVTVDYTMELCANKGFTPKVSQYIRDGQTMLYMVGANKGIAFCFSQVNIPNPNDVKILKIEDCDINFDFGLGYKKDNLNPAIPLFIDEIKRKAKSTNYSVSK